MVFHQKLCGTSKMRETSFWFAKREVDMTMTLERLKFTVEDYYKLVDAGILREESRVELIEGEIITMSPKSIVHNQLANRLMLALVNQLQGSYIVAVENTIRSLIKYLRA